MYGGGGAVGAATVGGGDAADVGGGDAADVDGGVVGKRGFLTTTSGET